MKKKKIKLYTKKKKIEKIINNSLIENIILPGGKSVNRLLKNINIKKNKKFMVTDERICFNNPSKLNSRKLSLLFEKNNTQYINKFTYNFKNNLEIKKNFKNQFTKINYKKTLIFIGFGEDGHYASIFKKKNYISSFHLHKNNNENFSRISITNNFIKKIRKNNIYLVGFGPKKANCINKSLSSVKNNYPINNIKYLINKIVCDDKFAKKLDRKFFKIS